jgi:hypothetical protein
MKKVKKYSCISCAKEFQTLGGWGGHVETIHPDTIPKDFTLARYFYYILTNKTHGNCIMCKLPTTWNETTMKYNRFCGREQCKKDYVKMCNERIIGKYGKTDKVTIKDNGKAHLLNSPDQQRKMVSNRSISGSYKFQDGKEIGYVGSYELNFLTMLDTFMNFDSIDIISPSPHHYYYDYKNNNDKEHEGTKFYIPDFYIPSLNLEVEIKENTNMHPKIIMVDKVKEKFKDELMKTISNVNYIKIVENDYSNFFEYFLKLKEGIPNDEKTIRRDTLLSANESTTNSSSSKSININDTLRIDNYFRYSKAVALRDICENTIIMESVVYGNICGKIDKMKFNNLANAVLANAESDNGNVKFVKYIDGHKEKYNLVSTKLIKKGSMLTYNATNDMPEFFGDNVN